MLSMSRVLSWALFDLANTFFAVAMLSFYFPLWVVEDRGGNELMFSVALGLSMACVAIAMPFCGALSDATGERMRYLRWTTYGCTGATFLVGLTPHLGWALVLFGIANICYQLGTIFYDALLWSLASGGRLGQVSGIGAAFGYLGSILGLLFLWPFARVGGHAATFGPSAVFFLLFALPCFLTIHDVQERRAVVWHDVVRTAAVRLAITIRSARAATGVWRYLWAWFFSSSAINAVLVFMAVYTKKVMGFTELQIIQFFVFSQVFAVAGSLVLGQAIPTWGAKRTLSYIWSGWAVALGLAAASPSIQWLWVVGPLIGFCLGSTWATARVLLIELSPKDQLAEMFGLAGLMGKLSSILGSVLWGLVVLDASRYRFAILSLIALLGIGLWLLRRVPSPTTSGG